MQHIIGIQWNCELEELGQNLAVKPLTFAFMPLIYSNLDGIDNSIGKVEVWNRDFPQSEAKFFRLSIPTPEHKQSSGIGEIFKAAQLSIPYLFQLVPNRTYRIHQDLTYPKEFTVGADPIPWILHTGPC